MNRPKIVLVHGAWADGSCWSTVVERLQADGFHVTAPQFPLSSLADDFARLRQVLESGELYARIGELPDVFREALVAVDVLGLSYREAARALKTREATVTTRLYRARLRLAKTLEEGGTGTSTREGLEPSERHYE